MTSTPPTKSRPVKARRKKTPKQKLRSYRQSRQDRRNNRPQRPEPPASVLVALKQPRTSVGLAVWAGKRIRVTATALRYGSRVFMKNGKGQGPMDAPVLILGDVTLATGGTVLAHRIMINVADGLAKAKLAPGDTFEFDARVEQGTDPRRPKEWRLLNPTKVQPLTRAPRLAPV